MTACSGGYGQDETAGRKIMAGKGDFIIITVEKSQAKAIESKAAQNSTAVSTDDVCPARFVMWLVSLLR